MKDAATRDFIYLDVERVRSIVAQNSGGVASERRSEDQHTTGGKAAGEGSLPFIAKVSGEADYHYMKSRSETLSLHDYIFSEFFDLLNDSNSLFSLDVPADDEWVEDRFIDGNFMITSGVLKIVDYQYAMEFMKAAPNLHKLISRISTGTQPQSVGVSGSRGKGGNQGNQADPFAGLPIKEVSTVVEQFFHDMVRVKVFPHADDPSKVFVGTADRDLFRYSPAALTNLYGPVIDAGWVSVLLINKGISYEAGQLVSKTGNAIEDGLEQLVDFAIQAGNMMQGIKFPAVAVTPIAIFREI
jgi:hypothetical protein